MRMEGCQGKPRTPTIQEKVCPRCGNLIEIFSIDAEIAALQKQKAAGERRHRREESA